MPCKHLGCLLSSLHGANGFLEQNAAKCQCDIEADVILGALKT